MKQRARRIGLGVTAVFLSIAAVVWAGQAKIDVTGEWIFTVETGAGSGSPTVTFKQEGEKLTGHYSSATLGEADFTGTLKGQAITFSFTAGVQDVKIDVVYTGTVTDKDGMKGTVKLGDLGDGTFTGKRK